MANTTTTYKLTGLGISNFRIFKQYQFFRIKPITILTGTNSAGKSTVGKALLLLKNSFDQNHLTTLVLNSSSSSLGTLEQITPYGMDAAKPSFTLHVQEDISTGGSPVRNLYELHLDYDGERLNRFSIHLNGQPMASSQIETGSYGMLYFRDSYFHYPDSLVNLSPIAAQYPDDYIHFAKIKKEVLQFLRTTDSIHNQEQSKVERYDKAMNILQRYIDVCTNDIFEIGDFYHDYDGTVYMNRDYMLKQMLPTDLQDKIKDKALLSTSITTILNNDSALHEYFKADFLSVFATINSNVLEYNISDLVIAKSKHPNIYTAMTSTGFDVDYFANEIKTLQSVLYYWIVERLKLVRPSSDFNKGGAYFHKTNNQFIRVIKGEEWGELIKIQIFTDNHWVPLSSLGYGTSNIILKIIQLILHNNVLLVEEPEANLHPSLQSKLADLVVLSTQLQGHDVINNPYESRDMYSDLPEGIKVVGSDIDRTGAIKIIETHSEYFIRRLQYLVASKDSPLTQEDVQIYYFNNPLEEDFDDESQIIDIQIQANGALTESFGTGFLDEADNIALELYLLQYK